MLADDIRKQRLIVSPIRMLLKKQVGIQLFLGEIVDLVLKKLAKTANTLISRSSERMVSSRR